MISRTHATHTGTVKLSQRPREVVAAVIRHPISDTVKMVTKIPLATEFGL